MKTLIPKTIIKNIDKIVNLFVFYSEKDNELYSQLMSHIKPLEKAFQMIVTNGHILPDSTIPSIDETLEKHDAILMLISSDFLSSDYYDMLLSKVIEKQEEGWLVGLGLIVRDCLWKQTQTTKLYILPATEIAITSHENMNEAWTHTMVVLGLYLQWIRQKIKIHQQKITIDYLIEQNAILNTKQ